MSKSRNEQRAERGNLRKWDKSHFPKYPFLPTLPYKFFAKPAATPSRIIESRKAGRESRKNPRVDAARET